VSKASDDLPEPETPVTTVKLPQWNVQVSLQIILASAPYGNGIVCHAGN
jgi:hypothetical protein